MHLLKIIFEDNNDDDHIQIDTSIIENTDEPKDEMRSNTAKPAKESNNNNNNNDIHNGSHLIKDIEESDAKNISTTTVPIITNESNNITTIESKSNNNDKAVIATNNKPKELPLHNKTAIIEEEPTKSPIVTTISNTEESNAKNTLLYPPWNTNSK